jgi:hypothetical protein
VITLVQTATAVTNSTYSPAVTVTFGSPVTAGNCLAVAISDFEGGVTGVTIGGSADNWAQAAAAQTGIAPYAFIWTDPHCAGGSPVIVASMSNGTGIAAVAWEFTGIASSSPVDQAAAANVFGAPYVTSFTSTATATTRQAQEAWIGCVATDGNPAISGPSSPWVNSAQLNAGVSSDATFMAGYQITSAAGAAAYAGTLTAGSNPPGIYGAAVATLLPGTLAGPVVGRFRRGTAAIVRSANW